MLFRSWIDCLFADFRQSGTQLKKNRTTRQSLAASLGVLRLERRRVLNGTPVPLDPTMLANPDSSPTANPNQAVTIGIHAGKTDNVETADVVKIARHGDRIEMTVNDSLFRSEDASSVHGIQIHSDSNALTLILDLSGGSLLLPGGISVEGGQGGGDTLVLSGASAGSVDYTQGASGSGQIQIDGASVSYAGIDHIVDTISAAERSFALSNPAGQATLSVAAQGGMSLIRSDAGASILFADPSGMLTVVDAAPGAGGVVTVDLTSQFNASLAVVGSSSGAVRLNGDLDLGSGSLMVRAGSIDVAGAVSTAGGSVQLLATTSITVEATGSVTTAGGSVVIDAGLAGTTLVSGQIDASSSVVGGVGGTVHLLGNRVGLLDGAQVDASGAAGGGTVLVGGDFQGLNPAVHNASQTTVARGASIHADATASGHGGKVIVWSDDVTRFSGEVTARGAGTGNGGFVELSSHGSLAASGLVDSTAADGRAGTLLLDPKNAILATGGTATLAQVATFASDAALTDTIDVALINAATSNVVVQASNDITVTDAIAIANPGTGLTLQAGRSIFVNASISTTNGAVTLIANETAASGVIPANRDPGAAVIAMAAGTQINAGQANVNFILSTGAGLLDSTSGNVTLGGVTTAGGGSIVVVNNGPTAGTTVILSQTLTTAAGKIDIDSSRIDLNASLNTDGGTIVLHKGAAGAPVADVRLGANVVLDTEQGNNQASGNVDLSDAVVSATVAGQNLTVDVTTGATFANGTVSLGKFNNTGGGQLVNDLTVLAAGAGIASPVTVAATATIQTTGNIVVNGSTVTVNAAVSTGTGDITLQSADNMVVNASVTATSGQILLFADADLNNNGTIVVGNGVLISTANTGATAITLRAADLNIDTTDLTTKAVSSTGAGGGVVIRTAAADRAMSIGPTVDIGGTLSLTDNELTRISTTATGSLTFGDTSHVGNISFITATPATTSGAAIVVLQSTTPVTGKGKITLDDGGAATALSGGTSTVTLTAGDGGIVSLNGANNIAEIGTTAATVTINTTGPIGTVGSPVQFADRVNAAQQVVVIGDTLQPLQSVFLGGVGTVTLGTISLGQPVAANKADLDVTSSRINLLGDLRTTGGKIVLHNGAAGAPFADVRLVASVTLDTEQTATKAAGNVDLSDAVVSAAATGLDLTIDVTTGATFASGKVTLGTFDNVGGGQFVNNLSVLASGAGIASPLTITAGNAVQTTGNILMDASKIDVNATVTTVTGNLSLQATGDVNIKANVDSGTGTLLAFADSDADGKGIVNVFTGVTLKSANVTASAITLRGADLTIDVSKAPASVTATGATGGVVIRSSNVNRPMSLGGADNAVAGVNLTDLELARITTAAQGTITFGDAAQVGDITFTTAVPATTPGAAVVAVQDVAQAGRINLDDETAATALSGAGPISLTAGQNGIVAVNTKAGIAEIDTTGATVNLDTVGPIGTAAVPIHFADRPNAAQQVVSIGASTRPAESVFLIGFGTLSLGTVDMAAPAAPNTANLDVDAPIINLNGNISTDSGDITLRNGAAGAPTADVRVRSSVTLDTNRTKTLDAGLVDFSDAVVSATATGIDLTFDVSTGAGKADGTITWNKFDNVGGGQFINNLTVKAAGPGIAGQVTLTAGNDVQTVGTIELDAGQINLNANVGTDGGNIFFHNGAPGGAAADVRINATTITLDTERGNDGPAGSVNLVDANVSALALNQSLLIDASTTAAGKNAGAISLGTFAKAGGQFVHNLTGLATSTTGLAGLIDIQGSVQANFDITLNGGAVNLPGSLITSDFPITGLTGTRTGNVSITSTGTVTVNGLIRTGSFAAPDQAGATAATSGNVTVTSTNGSITGAGRMITGNASVNSTTNDAGDTATSGAITLSIPAGKGAVTLSGADALTVGSATITNATGNDDTARVGNITVTADKLDNGTAGQPVDVSFGKASGGAVNTAGLLIVTTNGGADALGEIQVTSGEDLVLGPVNSNGGTIRVATTGTNTTLLVTADVTSVNGALTLRTTGNLTVASLAAGGTVLVSSGTGALYLGADLREATDPADGDDGVGTLTIGPDATITSGQTVAPAGTSNASITLRGADLVIDTSAAPSTVNATGTGGGVAIRTSVQSIEMNIGPANDVAGSLSLTDSELARITTVATGSVTFGDAFQTGNIRFTTATPATTIGTTLFGVQSTTGPGSIILDDDAGGTPGTALDAGTSTLFLTAGTGGVAAASAANPFAELATTGASITINTTGPIGTAPAPIQFADSPGISQQVIAIGTANQPALPVFLDGLGTLTLGSITLNNTDLNVTTGLVTAGGPLNITGPIQVGTGNVTLTAKGNITETGAGVIFANALKASAPGDISLNSANDVQSISLTAGVISFTDVNGFDVVNVTGALRATLISGGPVTESKLGSITVPGLELLGTGPYTLESALNNIVMLAANVQGNLSFTNSKTLIVGTVNSTAGITTSGIIPAGGTTAQGGDVTLTTLGPASALIVGPGGPITTMSGAAGNVTLTVGGDLFLVDTGSTLDISLVGDGQFKAKVDGVVHVSPFPPDATSFAPADSFIISTATGRVTGVPPEMTSVSAVTVGAVQIAASGIATVNMTIGRANEQHFIVGIDWGDGTLTTYEVTHVVNGSYTVTARIYFNTPLPAPPTGQVAPVGQLLGSTGPVTFVIGQPAPVQPLAWGQGFTGTDGNFTGFNKVDTFTAPSNGATGQITFTHQFDQKWFADRVAQSGGNSIAPIPVRLTLNHDPKVFFAPSTLSNPPVVITGRLPPGPPPSELNQTRGFLLLNASGTQTLVNLGLNPFGEQRPVIETRSEPVILPPPVPQPQLQQTQQFEVKTVIEQVIREKVRLVLYVIPPDKDAEPKEVEVLPQEYLEGDNLQNLFRILPNNRYRIVLEREGVPPRRILEVFVRDGRPFNAADEETDDAPRIKQPEPPADGEAQKADDGAALNSDRTGSRDTALRGTSTWDVHEKVAGLWMTPVFEIDARADGGVSIGRPADHASIDKTAASVTEQQEGRLRGSAAGAAIGAIAALRTRWRRKNEVNHESGGRTLPASLRIQGRFRRKGDQFYSTISE